MDTTPYFTKKGSHPYAGEIKYKSNRGSGEGKESLSFRIKGSPLKKGDRKFLSIKKGIPKRFGMPHKLIKFPSKERRSIYGKIINRPY